MPRLTGKPGRWRLRTRLLVPIVLLVLVAVDGLAVIEELAARKQAEAFVSQRGGTVLAAIAERLQERQRAKEIFAQLLTDEPGLATMVQQGDEIGVAQRLVPLKARLGLGFIDLYTDAGRELLALGNAESELHAPQVSGALSGMTGSSVAVGSDGLQVLASAPVKGPEGIVGALVVGTTLTGDALKEVKDREAVELAVFRGGQLVSTTVGNPELARLLGQSRLTSSASEQLSGDLAHFNYHVTVRPLPDEGLLVALVPTEDLVHASKERNLTVLVGTLGLVAALLLSGLLLARDIARPLQAMVATTEEMVLGNYHRRVAPSPIRELNDLANAINHLAQELDIQIAQRARTEGQLKASLKEKETLLQEIHHRVKNNLQIISSLLNLQAAETRDAQAISMLRESQNRIRSMALVHEKLYQSKDLGRIDFGQYIQSLAANLRRSYGANARAVSVRTDLADVSLSIDTALTCGLIVNELVSNAMKHAFPNGEAGEIRIELHPCADKRLTLIVGDDGVGLPKGLDFRNPQSLGMQLVMSLTRQLDGTLAVHNGQGTTFQITFADYEAKRSE